MGDTETRVALLTQAVESLSDRVARGFDKVYHILHGKTGADGLVGTVRLAERELEAVKRDLDALGDLEGELERLLQEHRRRERGRSWWIDLLKLGLASIIGALVTVIAMEWHGF